MEEFVSIAYYIVYATRRAANPIGIDQLRQSENFIAELLPYEHAAQDFFIDAYDMINLLNIHITRDQFLDMRPHHYYCFSAFCLWRVLRTLGIILNVCAI